MDTRRLCYFAGRTSRVFAPHHTTAHTPDSTSHGATVLFVTRTVVLLS